MRRMPRVADVVAWARRRVAEPGDESPGSPGPLLSVVVPVYQVEQYLAECLESLLAQTYRHLEIVVVDDGSTDGSGRIAERFAAVDPRIRLVRQPNAGLGAARNAGLALCTGELVAFADSDDVVPPAAYERMVQTLVRSGSDFVVGAYVRSGAGRDRLRIWVRAAHRHERLGVHIDDAPDLVAANIVAPTKVFRREFLLRRGLRFAEGVRYEDRVVMVRAYLEARAFDVVPDVVYRWRRRDDMSSISQGKRELDDLLDNARVEEEVVALLHASASPQVLREWYRKTFRADFLMYLRVAAEAGDGDGYWQAFRDHLATTMATAPPGLEDEMGLRVRLALWLASRDHRTAVRELVADDGFAHSDFPVTEHDGRLFAVVELETDPGTRVPADVTRIREVDLRMRPRLETLDWGHEGRLRVRCVAAVPFVDATEHRVDSEYALVDGERRLAFATTPDPGPTGNLVARRTYEDHSRSVLVGDVDLRRLVAASAPTGESRWELRVSAAALGLTTEATLQTRQDYGSAVLARAQVVDGALVGSRWSEHSGLSITVRRRYAAVVGHERADGAVRLTVRSSRADLSRVLLGSEDVAATLTPAATDPTTGAATDPSTYTLEVAREVLDHATPGTRLRVAGPGGRPLALVAAGPDPVPAEVLSAGLGVGEVGVVVVVPAVPRLLLDAVEPAPGLLRLRGRGPAGEVRVRLAGPRASTPWTTVGPADGEPTGSFVVDLRVRRRHWEGAEVPFPADLYVLEARAGAAGHDDPLEVVAGRLATDAAVAARSDLAVDGWATLVAPDGRPLLRRHRHERSVASRFDQRRLRSGAYEEARRGPRRDTVVFESFGGVSTGDSPRALYESLRRLRPAWDMVWSVTDPGVPAPPGSRAVVHGTPDWYAAVGSARVVVAGDLLPEAFVKAPGQLLVHAPPGSPVKHVGTDVAAPRLTVDRELRRMLAEARSWDVVLSPGPHATQVVRRAFGYAGRVLELGRPADDVLTGPDAPAVRAAVREELGLPADRTALLYAPTWRDDAREQNDWRKVLHLDAALVTRSRPDVTVLLRGHPRTSGRPEVHLTGPGADRVVDVTSYPDVARLLLAADLLVTDYSAVMHDFALTDRPVVLLAPDLDFYRDRVRGLYLDLETAGPGPVVETTEQVVALIGCDGHAAARRAARRQVSPQQPAPVSDAAWTELLALAEATPGAGH